MGSFFNNDQKLAKKFVQVQKNCHLLALVVTMARKYVWGPWVEWLNLRNSFSSRATLETNLVYTIGFLPGVHEAHEKGLEGSCMEVIKVK
jgi:hypothetical protein